MNLATPSVVDRLAENLPVHTPEAARALVQEVIDASIDCLLDHQPVRLKRLGTLMVVQLKPRRRWNIHTKTSEAAPARYAVVLKADPALVKALNTRTE